MSRLLSAGFTRLFKNRLFQASIVIMFAIGCFAGYTKWSDFNSGFMVDLSDALFTYCVFGGCVTAVLSSMFSGTEYSDGTIRNKIIAGCNRIGIYLSNLIINIVSGVLAVIAFAAPYITICLLTVGKSDVPAKTLILYVLLSLASLTAFSAIYNAITMLTAKKAAAAVACLMIFAALYMAGRLVEYRLQIPEFSSGYAFNAAGDLVETEPIPDPRHLTGAKRSAYEWAYDIIHVSQCLQIVQMEAPHPVRLACCAGGLVVIFTLAGAVIFNKKDLK